MSSLTDHDNDTTQQPWDPAPTWSDGAPVHGLPPLPPAPPTSAVDRRRWWTGPIASAAVAAVVAAGVAVPIARATAPQTPVSAVAAGEELTVTQIASAVSPSVARVSVASAQGEGSGSAVVYAADGVLVTNNHVVEGAAQVEVTLASGETHPAEVVGTDPLTDLAVLRIDVDDLPTVPFATAEPTVGETTVAIGSPFGLEGTVTSGIVSATNRTLGAQGEALGDLIQTDASINPGNSGGALVNGRGELVGLNTAILSGSGTSSGVGFAVPVSTVTDVADQILTDGTVVHAALGIAGQTVDARTAELYGLGVDAGAVIGQVQQDSAADRAGLRRGDIVTAIDGQPVASIDDLSVAVRAHRPGDTIQLDIVRSGDRVTIEATLNGASRS